MQAVARAIQLVTLLLDEPRMRNQLIGELAESLSSQGWADAMPSIATGGDGLTMVSRDLDTLKTLELVQIVADKPYRTLPGARLPVWLAPDEVAALETARLVLEQLGLPELKALTKIQERISEPLRKAGRKRALALSPSLGIGNDETWDKLHDGLTRGRQLRLTYKKPREKSSTFVIDRGRLSWMTHTYYLVAFRPSYAIAQPELPLWHHVREYRLDRIEAIEVLDEAVTLAAVPEFIAEFQLSAEMAERVFPLYDVDGRTLLDVKIREDGTLAVSMAEFSLLRAKQRLAAYGEHLLAVQAPQELRVDLLAMYGRLAERFRS